MPRFRKNPIVIEARQLGNTHEEDLEILAWCGGRSHLHPDRCDLYEIPTLEGVMIADMGDWVIKGIKGEFYPVKEEICKETYTPINPNTELESHVSSTYEVLEKIEYV